jgi:hypothetical protein
MVELNGMNRRLAEAANKEARTNQLANELFKRGLAMTMDSAKQLATSMVETELRVQKRFQERAHPSIGEGRPSYNEVARDSVMRRVYNKADEPIRQSQQREVPIPPVEGLPTGRTLRELHEEYERQQHPSAKESAEELLAHALNSEPIEVSTEYETPANGSGSPKMVEHTAPAPELIPESLAPEPTPEFIPEAVQELFPEPTLDFAPDTVLAPEPPEPTPEPPFPEPEDFIEIRPEHFPPEPPAAVPAPEETPADEAVEESFLPPQGPEDYAAPPGDEDATSAEEPTGENPPPAAEELSAKPKEDLAKKHGVDLNALFNVNK